MNLAAQWIIAWAVLWLAVTAAGILRVLHEIRGDLRKQARTRKEAS